MGVFHEATFYDSDEQFLAVVLPFLRQGVAAGEPTVSFFTAHNQRLLRDAVGPNSGVEFIDGDPHYSRPAVAIHRHRQMLAGYVADGATQIRIASEVPHPGTGVPWEWWARYEAAVNDVYNDYPMYGLCPYDLRITPDQVLRDARRTHPHIVASDGTRERCGTYQQPADFLADAVMAWVEPLEAEPPMVEVANPQPHQARQAVTALQPVARLSTDDLNGLLLSTSEAVTNALVHGRAPVLLRAWAVPGRIVVTVFDHGPGPANVVAGLVPAAAPGGLGLWLAHQMCAYVSLRRSAEGFSIRLVAGWPVGV
ncbi:sensor histidine kinase [Catellatospora methionotrophica]|uniref:sensor histidine kinase n=1 Tax=Catellatospora methionotrophica TaxID=121620 RepID=UPI003410DD63